jgi:hypothetical protein
MPTRPTPNAGTGPTANLASGEHVVALPDNAQPIPVHTVQRQDDALLLGHNAVACPKYGALLRDLRESSLYTDKDKTNRYVPVHV